MNKLKWYDFLGALILLFSVTKSAIKPPDTKDYTNTLLPPSAATTTDRIFQKIDPREAALSRIDMLSPSMSGDLITSEVQTEIVDGVYGEASNVGSNLIVKAIPKSIPRTETHPGRKDNSSLGLRSPGASFVPEFIY